MKTGTYLRLSLLIPFLVWGVCLPFLIIASTPPINELTSGESTTVPDWIMRFLAFYIFGILIWLFPYALLSLILLALSFVSQARVTMKMYALSPLAMTLLTIAAVNLFALGAAGQGTFFSNPTINYRDFTAFNILVVVISLIWGYICVCLGFGIYKTLQHLQVIKETRPEVGPIMNEAL